MKTIDPQRITPGAIQAVKKTRRLWFRMLVTGENKKEAYKNLWLGNSLLYCPLCDYAKSCPIDCPLLGTVWGNNCMADGSAYMSWYYAETKEEKEDACRRMVADCDAYLDMVKDLVLRAVNPQDYQKGYADGYAAGHISGYDSGYGAGYEYAINMENL